MTHLLIGRRYRDYAECVTAPLEYTADHMFPFLDPVTRMRYTCTGFAGAYEASCFDLIPVPIEEE